MHDITMRQALAGTASVDVTPEGNDPGPASQLIRLVAAPQHASVILPTALAAGLLCPAAIGAPGDLDPAFGNLGRVDPFEGIGQLWAVAPVGEDAFFYAGDDFYCGSYYGDYYCSEGFGFTGRLLGTGAHDHAYAAAVLAQTVILDIAAQTDGKAVGAGYSQQGGVAGMTVFRLLPDGALDTSFAGSGIVNLADPAGSSQHARSLIIESDGRVVVAGMRGNHMIVVRLLADGTLDLDFGTAGVYVGPVNGSPLGMSLARAPDGGYRITQSGIRSVPETDGCRVLALSAAGVPEASFGTAGIAPADGTSPATVTCHGLAVQADSSVVLVGSKSGHGFATRLLPSGAADPGFSGGGVAGAMRDASAVALGRSGSIIVAGHDKSGLSGALVVRLQANGVIDTLFGKDGAALVDLESFAPAHPTIRDVHVLADDGILVAGGSGTLRAFVARLLGSGNGPGIVSAATTTVLTSEGADAVVTVRRIGGSAGAISVAYQTEIGDASAGEDFTQTGGRLSWGDGDTGDRQVHIPITAGSAAFEPLQSFRLNLSDPQGGTALGTSGADVVIRGDGFPGGVLSLEGPSGAYLENAGFALLNVSRSYYSAGSVSVTLTPVGDSATADRDFTAAPVVVTWADGDLSTKQVRIAINNDKKDEPAESFSVALSAATGGAVVAPEPSRTVTINDNDAPGGGGAFSTLAALFLGSEERGAGCVESPELISKAPFDCPIEVGVGNIASLFRLRSDPMSRTLQSAPRRDGYRMPGEFEPHAGCWMLWPERPDTWRLGGWPAQRAFAALATAIAASEPVTMGVSAQQFGHARRLLPDSVRLVEMSHDDAWMRDVGPTFVVDDRGGRRGVDWQFNAWGGLHGGNYFPWDKDDAVAQKVLEIEGSERYRAPLILEGGSIHVDGQGTVITTEECLLNPNRNPGLTREQIETLLQRYLNVDVVIWLGKGVHLDETDGHVDNLCAYVKPGEVVLTWTRDKGDPQYDISRDAYERLMDARDARGRRLQVHKLQQPGPLHMTAEESAGVDAVEGTRPREAGVRLAGSYVNFYIGNRRIVVPLLDPRRDGAALRTLQELFPKREVVGVPGREFLLGGGNVHCVTQQVPLSRDRGRQAR